MRIIFDEEQKPGDRQLELFERAAGHVLGLDGMDSEACEISLTFVASDEMLALNSIYRNVAAPTDVLSFPMFENIDEVREALTAAVAPVMLGDVVICPEIAERQAEEYGHSAEREFTYLFVHSMLHLLGYDHEGEDEEDEAGSEGTRVCKGGPAVAAMRGAEETVLKQLGLAR